jgi:hypothetical protein
MVLQPSQPVNALGYRPSPSIGRYINWQSRYNFINSYKIRYFHAVLQGLLELYKEVVNLPTSETPLASRITNNPKYTTYFADCIGALDGTHIDVWVPPNDQARYRNRKGHLSQNVLAVCNFDMEFTSCNVSTNCSTISSDQTTLSSFASAWLVVSTSVVSSTVGITVALVSIRGRRG